MAGCELNIAHAFVAAPTAHRMRHDVIVTSADDFDASRRRRCVEDDNDSEADRSNMIPHYRLVPSSFGPGGGSEWVTLSKSVLLQLVERICQLSFQADSLPVAAAATAACPPSDRVETSSDVSMDAVGSTDVLSTATAAERSSTMSSWTSTGATTDEVAAAASEPGNVEISNNDSCVELTAEEPVAVVDSPAASDTAFVASADVDLMPSQELDVDAAVQEANRDDDEGGDDSDVFSDPVAMHEESEKTENSSSSLAETPPSASTAASDMAVPEDAPSSVSRKPPSPTTPLHSTQSLRADRRRRLRELRRLRRHRQGVVNGDDLAHDRCRDRRRDAIVRRRFAVPRQPPPRFHDRQIADVEGTATDAMRLQIGCRYGRVSEPWSALNKLVVCQLVDVVLSQELTPTTTTWRSATTSGEKRRSSGTIWNPAITPETRESRVHTPPRLSWPTVADLTSLESPSPVDPGSSTLLKTLLSPMSMSYLDRRRSDASAVNSEVGGSLAWPMSQSSTLRRRHHSAAAPDTFHAPWTPSFFWYNVPPSQGNFFLLPEASSRRCYRWISDTQPTSLPPPPPSSAAVDACALDYRVRTLDSPACPDTVESEAREVAAAGFAGVPRQRGSRPSKSPSSVSSRGGSSARLKWVVVSKTDVCSLFESLASSMVEDSDDKRTSEEASHEETTGRATLATNQGSVEPIKWKSTLLRRARAEAETPTRSASNSHV